MEGVSIKKIMIGVLALLPLLLSLAWLISLLMTKNTLTVGADGVMLSPVQNTTPIVISLVMFMLGYIIFLVFVFSHNIRRRFEGIVKRNG